jgi:hypothetical protein
MNKSSSSIPVLFHNCRWEFGGWGGGGGVLTQGSSFCQYIGAFIIPVVQGFPIVMAFLSFRKRTEQFASYCLLILLLQAETEVTVLN